MWIRGGPLKARGLKKSAVFLKIRLLPPSGTSGTHFSQGRKPDVEYMLRIKTRTPPSYSLFYPFIYFVERKWGRRIQIRGKGDKYQGASEEMSNDAPSERLYASLKKSKFGMEDKNWR